MVKPFVSLVHYWTTDFWAHFLNSLELLFHSKKCDLFDRLSSSLISGIMTVLIRGGVILGYEDAMIDKGGLVCFLRIPGSVYIVNSHSPETFQSTLQNGTLAKWKNSIESKEVLSNPIWTKNVTGILACFANYVNIVKLCGYSELNQVESALSCVTTNLRMLHILYELLKSGKQNMPIWHPLFGWVEITAGDKCPK